MKHLYLKNFRVKKVRENKSGNTEFDRGSEIKRKCGNKLRKKEREKEERVEEGKVVRGRERNYALYFPRSCFES
jgi:hypothetical protein